jgi:hypothetical protein
MRQGFAAELGVYGNAERNYTDYAGQMWGKTTWKEEDDDDNGR